MIGTLCRQNWTRFRLINANLIDRLNRRRSAFMRPTLVLPPRKRVLPAMLSSPMMCCQESPRTATMPLDSWRFKNTLTMPLLAIRSVVVLKSLFSFCFCSKKVKILAQTLSLKVFLKKIDLRTVLFNDKLLRYFR